jgi:dolichol kinase
MFTCAPQVGIIAISQMAAGDGMADIVGRKFGIQKWPFSKDKSYIGESSFLMPMAVIPSDALMVSLVSRSSSRACFFCISMSLGTPQSSAS